MLLLRPEKLYHKNAGGVDERVNEELLQVILNNQKEFQGMICNSLQQSQTEQREGAKRIHERLDQIVAKAAVSSEECEGRRNHCRACTDAKIKDVSGLPPWVLWLGTGSGAALAGMAMYILTGGK